MIEHNIRWKGTNSLDIPGKIIECKSATEARFHPLRDQSLLPWIPSDIYACHGKKGHVALEQSGFVRCKSLLDPVQVTKRGGGARGWRDKTRHFRSTNSCGMEIVGYRGRLRSNLPFRNWFRGCQPTWNPPVSVHDGIRPLHDAWIRVVPGMTGEPPCRG